MLQVELPHGSSAAAILSHLLHDGAAAGMDSSAASQICRILHSVALQTDPCTATQPALESSSLSLLLLRVYGRYGAVRDAEDLFSRSQHRDKFSWNDMMKCYGRSGLHSDAVGCFDRMQVEGVLPDMFIYATALSEIAAMAEEEEEEEEDRGGGKGYRIHAALAACSMKKSMDEAVGTALVDMYGKAGRAEEALRAFEAMEARDLTSWNAMLWSLAQKQKRQRQQQGEHDDAGDGLMRLFERMLRQKGVSPSKVTFVCMLPAMQGEAMAGSGMELHRHILLRGFEADPSVGSALVSMYGRCGRLQEAGRAMEELGGEKTALPWTAMMAACIQQGRGEEAMAMAEQMAQEGALPDMVTCISSLSACCCEAHLCSGKRKHAIAMAMASSAATQEEKQQRIEPEIEIELEIELQNAVLSMYSRCGAGGAGAAAAARGLFDAMPRRSAASWNAMIHACSRHGRAREAIQLFFRMLQPQERMRIDRVTIATALAACCCCCCYPSRIVDDDGGDDPKTLSADDLLGAGRAIHSIASCRGLCAHAAVGNALARMYARHGLRTDARHVLESLAERDVASWNLMIASAAAPTRLPQLHAQMLEEGTLPDRCTTAGLLASAGCLGLLAFGKAIHATASSDRGGLDVSTGNRLIAMYRRCADPDRARDAFDCMRERDTVTWTEMISGYAADARHCHEAVRLFEQMQCEGLGSDRVTFVSIVSACAAADHAGLASGMRIHASSLVGAVSEHDVAVGNALISMYGKHGSVEEARRAFDRMPARDVVSWSAVIDCYAQHGRSEDALGMFEQLLRREQHPPVEPDQATLLSVLGACSHAGAIAEGWHCFASMARGLAIKPTVDHYNCVLDMLGRAGMVEAAESVIWDMPLAADTVSWLTLLCACRQHADVERGHRAARRALALDPSCLVAYTVLSNVYSAADRLQDEEPSAL